ncbi:unnamed protein product [marine sediment metagenome]|uniref:Uncharacterized protein n=1 Tax=marine sediment metagenome TaxID=412755 RepID=X1G2G0_9ZZZZ
MSYLDVLFRRKMLNSTFFMCFYMDSAKKQVITDVKRVYKSQKESILPIVQLFQREKHRKKMKALRNKRYYQRHKDKILKKQQLKNKLYADFIQHR